MDGLYKYLPPFAPDYSGVCAVLFEMGGIVVIHDAGGCTGNYTGYDEPRWYDGTSAVFSSGLRENEAVLGDEEKLLGKLNDAAAALKRKFIAILGSPAPMVMGTDYRALARIISKRTGLPALAFDTNGMKLYDVGQSTAFMALAQRFINPFALESLAAPEINIIGATPLDMGSQANIRKVIDQIKKAGYSNISIWGMGAQIDDITPAYKAKLNIIVSWSGLATARYMQEKYHIPYVTGIPIGDQASRYFRDIIRHEGGIQRESNITRSSNKNKSDINKVLIIGEQVMSNSIRTCLRMDFGISQVNVASFLSMDNALREKEDIFLQQEDDLAVITQQNHCEVIIGDPLYKAALNPEYRGRYIEFPHIALSSRLYWDRDIDYIGEGGKAFFEKQMMDERSSYNYWHERET